MSPLWKSLCPCCSLWPWPSVGLWWRQSRSRCPGWWNWGSSRRLSCGLTVTWHLLAPGAHSAPSPETCAPPRRTAVRSAASCSDSTDPFDAHLDWRRRCKTTSRPLRVCAGYWVWVWWLSPPGTFWSAGWACVLTPPRDDGRAGAPWAPPAASVWRLAPLRRSRHVSHGAHDASVCVLAF